MVSTSEIFGQGKDHNGYDDGTRNGNDNTNTKSCDGMSFSSAGQQQDDGNRNDKNLNQNKSTGGFTVRAGRFALSLSTLIGEREELSLSLSRFYLLWWACLPTLQCVVVSSATTKVYTQVEMKKPEKCVHIVSLSVCIVRTLYVYADKP